MSRQVKSASESPKVVINLSTPFSNMSPRNFPLKSPSLRVPQMIEMRAFNMRMYLFWLQGGFSIIIISFCFAMLVRGGSLCDYLPVITGILGYWLPSPKYSNSLGIASQESSNENDKKKVSYVSNNNIIIETQPKRKHSLDSSLSRYKTADSTIENMTLDYRRSGDGTMAKKSPNSTMDTIRRSLEKIVRRK